MDDINEKLVANGMFSGATLLDLVASDNNEDLTDFIRELGGKHSSIIWAAIAGDINAVEVFLDAGVDVNAIGKYGRTPLHYAATRGLKKIIELLIARGADVNTKIEVGDYKGHTPLDGAIQWNHPETADLLRKHGGKTEEELNAEGK